MEHPGSLRGDLITSSANPRTVTALRFFTTKRQRSVKGSGIIDKHRFLSAAIQVYILMVGNLDPNHRVYISFHTDFVGKSLPSLYPEGRFVRFMSIAHPGGNHPKANSSLQNSRGEDVAKRFVGAILRIRKLAADFLWVMIRGRTPKNIQSSYERFSDGRLQLLLCLLCAILAASVLHLPDARVVRTRKRTDKVGGFDSGHSSSMRVVRTGERSTGAIARN